MTIAEWCLLAAVLLYLATLAVPKALAPKAFDNAAPRDPAFYEPPMRKRALGAHINDGIETFPFFAVAVLLAEFRASPQAWTDGLALGFIAARLLFVWAYVADRPTARTVLWNVAFAFNIGLFFLAGYGPRGATIGTLIGLLWAAALWPLLSRLSSRRAS